MERSNEEDRKTLGEDGTVTIWDAEGRRWIRVQLQVALEMAAMDLAAPVPSLEERDRWAMQAEARLDLSLGGVSYAGT